MNKIKEKSKIGLTSQKAIEKLKAIQNYGSIIFGASGEMGSKITSTLARAGIPVIMQDIDKNKLEESKNEAIKTLEKAVNKRKLSKKQVESILEKKLIDKTITFPERGKIPFAEINSIFDKSPQGTKSFVEDFINKNLTNEESSRYKNAMMVLEAGPEILSFKQDVFRFFELAFSSNSAILATNTSSLKIDDIGAKVKNKERIVGFHYFLPAHVNSLIEIIKGNETSNETLCTAYNLAIAMGKKPIICWKDMPGAIANRVLVGILNEAAKIYDDGLGSSEEIDKIFLEVFYSKQIKIKTKKAKKQFQSAPKLAFFKDEKDLYSQILKCAKTKNNSKKIKLLEEAEGRLRQKVLYAQIVENLSALGEFFTPAPCVGKLKVQAQEQMKNIRACLNGVDFKITPYDFPKPEKTLTSGSQSEIIRERLQGAYIAISQKIYNEGLSTIYDVELACKEGFKWNIGPFELIYNLGAEKSRDLVSLVNKNITRKDKSGIASPEEVFPVGKRELSGIQTNIQDQIGFITLGRLHIQNLQMMQNSISPEMLEEISVTLKELKEQNVKAIIFRSQGGGAFSSGADLNYIESTNWDTKKIVEYMNLGKKVMKEISDCNIPTTAILDGPAVGGGLELALACDYRIMTDLSFVAMPEVALGIIPDWGGTEKLPAIIGKELAKRMICTATLKNMGLKLSAEDAKLLGLADACVLQCELPEFLNQLINGKVLNVDIYKKSLQKANYNKSDYPIHIVKRFNLNKPFKHNFRWITKYAAKLAEDLIDHSDNPEYARNVNTDLASIKLLNAGKEVSNRYIKPMLYIVQNKFLAGLFEKIGLV